MVNMFLCGAFTNGKKKPCKHCKRFMLWGVNTGLCDKTGEDMQTWDSCKYFKRDSFMYSKNGKCKHPELQYL